MLFRRSIPGYAQASPCAKESSKFVRTYVRRKRRESPRRLERENRVVRRRSDDDDDAAIRPEIATAKGNGERPSSSVTRRNLERLDTAAGLRSARF